MLRTLLTISLCSFSLTAYAQYDKLVATVNGEKLYQSELDRNLEVVPNYENLSEDEQHAIKTKILKSIAQLTAVVQEARKLNIDETEHYTNQLSDIKKQLMYSTLLEKHLETFTTEEKLRKYYEKNKQQFIENKAKASHILVSTKPEASRIIQELAAGADFAELAKQYSIGPSSKNKGDLGWFGKNEMVSAFSDAAFKLNKGDYSKTPVKTQFGWHIIFLEDKIENTPSLFKDVQEKIKEKLMQKEVDRYLESIFNKAEIIIND